MKTDRIMISLRFFAVSESLRLAGINLKAPNNFRKKGLTMSTLDMIEYFGGKAANFLDVGGGADRKRVCSAVKLVSGMEGVEVIVVNLLGGITRCDEVAAGIVEADVPQQVVVRLAGTNEAEGKRILTEKGYRMLDSMEDVVKFAVEEAN